MEIQSEIQEERRARQRLAGHGPAMEGCPDGFGQAGDCRAFTARARFDLYRLAVFSLSAPMRMARSMAESVSPSNCLAAGASPEAMALRKTFMAVRTRLRFARFTSVRRMVCRIRFNTDFFRFFCFLAVACAI